MGNPSGFPFFGRVYSSRFPFLEGAFFWIPPVGNEGRIPFDYSFERGLFERGNPPGFPLFGKVYSPGLLFLERAFFWIPPVGNEGGIPQDSPFSGEFILLDSPFERGHSSGFPLLVMEGESLRIPPLWESVFFWIPPVDSS